MEDNGDGLVVVHHCDTKDGEPKEPVATGDFPLKPPLNFKQMEEDGKHAMQFSEMTGDVPYCHVDTPQSFQAFVERMRPLYGAAFCTNEEFELFMRLPISDADRLTLFQRLTTTGKGAKRSKPER